MVHTNLLIREPNKNGTENGKEILPPSYHRIPAKTGSKPLYPIVIYHPNLFSRDTYPSAKLQIIFESQTFTTA